MNRRPLWFMEVQLATRRLTSSLGFSLPIVIILATAMAVATSSFAVLASALLRPLPFKDASRLIVLWDQNTSKGLLKERVAPARFLDWQSQMHSLQQLAALSFADMTLTGGAPQRIRTAAVTSNVMSLLDIDIFLGRGFSSLDSAVNSADVVVVNEKLWSSRYHRSQKLLGQTITINGRQYVVIGIAKSTSIFPDNVDVWFPLKLSAWDSRVARILVVIGLIRNSSTFSAVQSELQVVSARMQSTYPDTDSGWVGTAVPIREEVVRDFKVTVIMVWISTFLLLLIACSNVANLFLIRFQGKTFELATREALGAPRSRLIFYLWIEPAILTGTAAIVSVPIAYGVVLAVRSIFAAKLHRLPALAIDWRVLAFLLIASCLTTVIAGVLPALKIYRDDLSILLHADSRVATRSSRITQILVSSEIALAVSLVLYSGLLARSFVRLHETDPGFKIGGLFTGQVSLPRYRYPSEASRAQFCERMLDDIRAVPSVLGAEVSTSLPLAGDQIPFNFSIEGIAVNRNVDLSTAELRAISPGYLKMLSILLIRGRGFTERDNASEPKVLLINIAMQRRFFEGIDPIGKKISIDGSDGPWRTIVGVVADTRDESVEKSARPQMYFPYLQEPWPFFTLVIKDAKATSSEAEMRKLVASVDPEIALYNFRSGDNILDDSLAPQYIRATTLSCFAFIGTLLAGIGTYSVVANSTVQRRKEIGIRMALGAKPSQIKLTFILEGIKLIGAGLALGVLFGIIGSRLISGFLYEVKPIDLFVYVTTAVSFFVVGLVATAIPATRAARVDPAVTLRNSW